MPIRRVDPETGAISFIPTEDEELEQNNKHTLESLIKRVEELEARVKELEEVIRNER